MPDRTLAKAATEMINSTTRNIDRLGDVSVDQLVAVCAVRAQLATATALLDVADAIRSNDTGASMERALDRMTAVLSRTGGRG